MPQTYSQYTGRYLLVSEWIEGQRVSSIDVNAPGGRQRLQKIIATMLNAYLTQLLDSGFLHAGRVLRYQFVYMSAPVSAPRSC